MSPRRVSLPAADDLFRRTEGQPPGVGEPAPSPVRAVPSPGERAAQQEQPVRRTSSGRVRHDEKVTVYVTADELVDLERARLTLRSEHGLAVDRGRLIREAVAVVLADLETRGEDSVLVARLGRD